MGGCWGPIYSSFSRIVIQLVYLDTRTARFRILECALLCAEKLNSLQYYI